MKLRTKVTIALTLLISVATVNGLHAREAAGETLTLTVERALEIALNENLSVKIAGEEIKRVDWLKRENWYSLLPSLGTNAQYTKTCVLFGFFSGR